MELGKRANTYCGCHKKNEMNRNKKFNAPMPLPEFRCEVKRQMEAILVSYKSKTKVVTKT